MIEWLNVSMYECMIEWLSDWMIGWLNDWIIELLNNRMIEWSNDCTIVWLHDRIKILHNLKHLVVIKYFVITLSSTIITGITQEFYRN